MRLEPDRLRLTRPCATTEGVKQPLNKHLERVEGGARASAYRALRRLRRERHGTASVEMALVSLFILFPLLAGMVDFVFLLSARYEINSALESFDLYAWNNPGAAGNVAALAALLATINQRSPTQITFPDGAADASTSYTPTVTLSGSGSPQTEIITYTLTARVNPLIPLPYAFAQSFTLSASSQVQVQ